MKIKLALALCTAFLFSAFPILAQSESGFEHGRGKGRGHGNNSNHSGHDDDGNSAGHRKDRPHGFGDRNLVLANHADAAAVAASMTSVRAALQSGSLSTPAGKVLPREAQGRTYAVLSGESRESTSFANVSAALSAAGPEASAIVPSLVKGFSELSSNPAQLPSVVSAFNNFTKAASNEFIANPPPEFLAMHAVLARLIVAGGPRQK